MQEAKFKSQDALNSIMGLEILYKSLPEVERLEDILKLEEKGMEFVKGFKYSEKMPEPDRIWLVAEQAKKGRRCLFELNQNSIDGNVAPSEFPENLLFGSFEKADGVYNTLEMWLKHNLNNVNEGVFKDTMLFVGESVKYADYSLKKWNERTGKFAFDDYIAMNSLFGQIAGTLGLVLAMSVPEWTSYSIQSINPLVSLPLLSSALGIWLGHKKQKNEVLGTYKNSIMEYPNLADAFSTSIILKAK